MSNMYVHDKIDHWVSDFCLTDHIQSFSIGTQDIADSLLRAFLYAACDPRAIEPQDIEEADIKTALLGTVARLNIPENLRGEVPSLCSALLAYLEEAGRLSGGRVLGAFAIALSDQYLQAATGKSKPITNPGSKIGRNDPCPCGSGKKYKKCCMRE